MAEMSFNRAPSLLRIARMLDCMARQPRSAKEIAAHVHVSQTTVYQYLKHLKAEGRIRIAMWRRRENWGGTFEAYYVAEPGQDAPKPARLSPAVVHRRRVKRLKDEGLYELTLLVPRRGRNRKPKSDPMVALFFGMNHGTSTSQPCGIARAA